VEPHKTPRERAEDLLGLLVPDWRPTAVQVLWTIRITFAVAIVLSVLAIIGYSFGITLWDWLRVLAVPITIGAAVPLLNWLQKKRELDVENQRAQDEALKAYLDQLGQLLLDKDRPLRQSKEGDEVRTLARARTKEVLWKMSPHRKRDLLQFLYEASLIKCKTRIIDLSGADLSNAYLRELDLRDADLTGADIEGADFSSANLSETDLRGAMNWSEEQLSEANCLKGALLPNGQKYEDWLKSKNREVGGKNDGSS
jgi:Pentapeptide repeats (8 copies)